MIRLAAERTLSIISQKCNRFISIEKGKSLQKAVTKDSEAVFWSQMTAKSRSYSI